MCAIAIRFQVLKYCTQVDKAVADKAGVLEYVAALIFSSEQVEDGDNQRDDPEWGYEREKIKDEGSPPVRA